MDVYRSLFLLLFLATSAHAATYTVGPDGNLAAAVAQLQAGDTLYVRGGTYSQGINTQSMALASGTSWSNPVTISAMPGEQVTLLGGVNINGYGSTSYRFLIISGFVIDGPSSDVGVFIGGPLVSDIRIQDNEIRGARDGIESYDSTRIELLRNRVHNNGTSRLNHGMYVLFSDGLIEGNEIYDNSGYGLQFYYGGCQRPPSLCGSNTVIRNNRIYNNHGDGNVTLNHGDNIQFYDNQISGGTNCIEVSWGAPVGTSVHDNTCRGSGSITVSDTAINTRLYANVIEGGGITDRGSGTTTDPGPASPPSPAPIAPKPRPAPKNLRVMAQP
jgi:parallel beta-helix repeat protein